jgi:hypothetical protein
MVKFDKASQSLGEMILQKFWILDSLKIYSFVQNAIREAQNNIGLK